jgi:predicted nucleic acid-binding protein
MGSICLIDTSIFLNLLNVPSRNESREEVRQDFETFIEADCTFLLPMATILETGNHIAQNGDGNTRRATAQNFVKRVQASFLPDAPWRPIDFPSTQEISTWLELFPDLAGKNKAPSKPEGTSFGDLSIIQDFKKTCQRFPMSEVFIWSLDQDLQSYRQDIGSR